MKTRSAGKVANIIDSVGTPAARKKRRVADRTRLRIDGEHGGDVEVSTSLITAAGAPDPDGSGNSSSDSDAYYGGRGGNDGERAGSVRAPRQPDRDQQDDTRGRSRRASTPPPGGNQGERHWWDTLTADQQRAIAIQLITPATMSAAVAPPPPAAVAVTAPKKKRNLGLEDFYGNAGENIATWLDEVPQAAQRRLRLYGEEWTSGDLYYGVSDYLKGSARKWFTRMNTQTSPENRTLEYLSQRLRETYGSKEDVWQTQLRLIKRRQQPGERLRDYANSLCDIGAGHRGVADECYVDAFIRGMHNRVSAQFVRSTGHRR